MSSPLLTCPLCSQPGFQTLDSLRYGLISAATRQVVCPVCHDILFGLDKFTIHLFSHSVHQLEVHANPLPIHLSDLSWTTVPLNQQTDNLLICTQPDLNSKVINIKEIPVSKQNVTSATDKTTHSTICTGTSVHDTNENKVTDKLRIVNTEEKWNTNANEQQQNKLSEKQEGTSAWEKHDDKLSCKYNYNAQNKEIQFPVLYMDKNESLPVQTKTKSQSVLKSMELSDSPISENSCSSEDHKRSGNFSTGNVEKQNSKHSTVSVQCSALPLTLPSEEKMPTLPSTEEPVKKMIKCNICGFSFDDSSILAIHHQLVHPLHNGSGTLNQKIQAANSSKQGRTLDDKCQFPCHLCSKVFKMRGSLMVHLRVAHSSGIGTGKLFIGRIDPDCHAEERKFSCHLCSKSFKKEQHLSQHLKTHEGKQWECDVCSKLFTTKYFLKKHKRLHTGETPYSCETCGKTFTFQQSYHKHLLYHSDDKPHVCTECDRAFKELSTLHNHQRIHTGEKPFSCETCGKCFRQRVSYLVHRRIHTGAMPYQCTACGKNFRYKVSQRTHKCPSQPPGIVVRQSGDLVQKLLQGVQQKAGSSDSQVPPFVSNKEQKGAVGESELSISQGLQDGCHPCFPISRHQNQHQQSGKEQFTVIIGNDMHTAFSSDHILSTPNSLYSVLPKQGCCAVSTDNLESKKSSNKQSLIEKPEIAGIMNKKLNRSKSQKLSISNNPMEVTDIKISKEGNDGNKFKLKEDDNGYLNVNATEKNGYEQSQLTVHSESKTSSNLGNVEETFFQKKCSDKINNFNIGKKLSPESLLHAFQVSTNDDPTCSSVETWKSSNKIHKSHDNSDLTVETTDFFTMVMSPTSKSLPSPSERLQHLSLSSPVDTLLNYEDDGMFQFLLNSDETSVQGKKNESCSGNLAESLNPVINSEKLVNQRMQTNQNNNSSNSNNNNNNNKTSNLNKSEPLETINEDSLKQLLYRSSKS